ncbi:MAG: hypothetical protein GY820_39035 [Gammaproteobacteria bacterium]|nr:hypothetical protein [Gammaproteobacteria bacterium]
MDRRKFIKKACCMAICLAVPATLSRPDKGFARVHGSMSHDGVYEVDVDVWQGVGLLEGQAKYFTFHDSSGVVEGVIG